MWNKTSVIKIQLKIEQMACLKQIYIFVTKLLKQAFKTDFSKKKQIIFKRKFIKSKIIILFILYY